MKTLKRVQVAVVGSGPGGSVTALEMARAGMEVLVLEEGDRVAPAQYGGPFTEALPNFYRDRGMNPIWGRVPIGWVEGRCLGGGSEINSGFWQRTPAEVLERWSGQYGLVGASADELAPHFAWAEERLGVGPYPGEWPASTRLFARGLDKLGWSYHESPRTASQCRGQNRCPSGCPSGAKQGMSRTLIPQAEEAGARFLTGRRVMALELAGSRVKALRCERTGEDGRIETERVEADHFFICAGPIQTPWLLLGSGIARNVGRSLQIHPMLKVIARFEERVDAERSVIPLIQVTEFRPDVTLGGAYYSSGQAAMLLGENWPSQRRLLEQCDRLAAYYVAVKGQGLGRVAPSRLDRARARISYGLGRADLHHLTQGLARLCQLLLAAGAREVLPAVHGLGPVTTPEQAESLLRRPPAPGSLALTTVHAFSSCPAGEKEDYCATDSFGRVHGLDNLYLGDASIVPNSPGVNPQAGVMALARRNVLHFLARRHG